MGRNKTSSYTARKQEDFYDVLKVVMTCARAAIKRQDGDRFFHYLDLNAASGSEDGYEDGSPLIALRIAFKLALPLRCWFFEEKAAKAGELDERITHFLAQRSYFDCEHQVIIGDHRETVPLLLGRFEGADPDLRPPDIFGIAYADPYGIPCYEILGRISRVPLLQKLDILVHLAATPHKRRGYSPVHRDHRRVSELLGLIEKRRVLIREYDTRHQFTMAFCTNWTTINDRIFQRNGFHDIGSETGIKILRELDLSNSDLKKQGIKRHPRTRQLRLPLD
jgi:hypothetical protein